MHEDPGGGKPGKIVVWSGFGFVTVVIAFGALGAAVLQSAIASISPAVPSTLGMAIGLLIAAAANWYFGKYLNTLPGRELVDLKTNQRITIQRRHSLCWTPMEFFPALLLVAAVAIISPSTFDAKRPAPQAEAT